MKPISVGDLVMVVKPKACCGSSKRVGLIFTVDNFYSGPWGETRCCGAKGLSGVLARINGEWDGYDIHTLKRIPPLSELESTKSSEEITA